MMKTETRGYDARPTAPSTVPGEEARPFPDEAIDQLRQDMKAAGGAYPRPADDGQLGLTMFDTPGSEDDTIPVLLHRDNIGKLPSQATVRIRSRDGRVYLGTVVRGPLSLPDGLRPDAPPVVATAIRGGFFLPEYHGLVFVEMLGEEKNGQLHPNRFRPLPNSPVFVLSVEEVRHFLGTGGNIRLGAAFGYDDLEIAFSSDSKNVLPRHTAVLGTTGGGKSTTIATLIGQLQQAGVATILLDTEGEYTTMNTPSNNKGMLQVLSDCGRKPAGIPNTHIHYVVGRSCSNPGHPRTAPFSPSFCNISPYAALEIFDLNEAQEERFYKALEVVTRAFNDLQLWTPEERRYVDEELDELESGYPKMRLSHLYDVARAIADILEAKRDDNTKKGAPAPTVPLVFKSPEFRAAANRMPALLDVSASSLTSWRKVQGKLGRVERLNIFDNPGAKPLDYHALLKPGRVSIIDLSDTDSNLINNLIITDLLRGVQKAQDTAYAAAERAGKAPTPVVVIIEEAHEFLSSQRIGKMPTLHHQVERIAKRGRKRWLGLIFVTQLPQHLPDEILGLVNNFVLHKIGDSNVISRLKHSVSGLDDSLWNRLPRLAPGQAVVSLSTLSRPMLTAIDPAPCKLRMVE